MSSAPSESPGNKRRNILVLLPLIVLSRAGGLVLCPARRRRSRRRLPSALIGRAAPPTDLPPLAGLARDGKAGAGPHQRDVHGRGDAGQCLGVVVRALPDEVPFLEKLAKDKRIQLVGINYKDPPDNARRFLNRYGNPFVAVGVDANGRTSIDWGVYGVPETYLVGRDGTHRLQAGRPDHRRESRPSARAGNREGCGQDARARICVPRCICSAAAFAARRTETSAAPRRTI